MGWGWGVRGRGGAGARTHTEAFGTPRLTERLPGECGAGRVPDEGGEAENTSQAPRGRESRAGTAWQPSRPGPGVAPEGGARLPVRRAPATGPLLARTPPPPRALTCPGPGWAWPGGAYAAPRPGAASRGVPGPGGPPPLRREPPSRGPGLPRRIRPHRPGRRQQRAAGARSRGGGAGGGRIARARRALEGCSRRGDNAARPGRAPAAASAGGGARRGAGPGRAGRGLREAGRRRGSGATRFLCADAPAPPRALRKAPRARRRVRDVGLRLGRRAPRGKDVCPRPFRSPQWRGGLLTPARPIRRQ